ncbi:MAG: hypothetical protein KGJ94_06660 [Xanthomonadaceae bacterium]|nr:hypothetical protein [Xanthomonadaceae bacterium]
MRKALLLSVPSLSLAVLLGACAGMSTESMPKSLHLLDAKSDPDYGVLLACEGKDSDSTVQCETVREVFAQWSQARHVNVQRTDVDATPFKSGRAALVPDTAMHRYTIAIDFEPIVIPSYNSWSGTAGTMTSGFVPGRVGYNAEVYVVSADTGTQLDKFSLHDQENMPQHADVTPTMKTEIYKVIARIDPGYSP